MSKYTTGEIAKLCQVAVRTVQYYDTRGILVPSELSDGGRRIYTEKDLEKMKAICFLRELDLPINSIKELMSEEHPEDIISIILDEHEKVLQKEIAEKQARYQKLQELKKSLKRAEGFSVASLLDIAHIMANKKKLRTIRAFMLAMGTALGFMEIGMLALWILKGYWLPFAGVMCAAAAIEGTTVFLYYKQAAYICPGCHTVFRPSFKEFMLAKHSPSIRKLTCKACNHNGYCVEIYGKEL